MMAEAHTRAPSSFRAEELPDGACISPKHVNRPGLAGTKDPQNTVIREAEYAGSFSVGGDDQSSRTQHVRKLLDQMKAVKKKKPVLLIMSLSGIKVCNSTGDSVYMAHALKRISYATCDPDSCQFSFLAREPKETTNTQYCHTFFTNTPEEAQELNSIVGNAFKMAYYHQTHGMSGSLGSRQPSFHDVIQQQLLVQKEEYREYARAKEETLAKRLSLISTPKIDERVKELKERRKKEEEEEEKREAELAQGKDRGSWAKQNAGKKKHRLPLVDKSPPPNNGNSSPLLGQDGNASNGGCNGDVNHSKSSTSSPGHFATLDDLREAFMSGALKSHASPVLSLKESIDEFFKEHGSENATRAALLALQSDSTSSPQKNGLSTQQNRKETSRKQKQTSRSSTTSNHSIATSTQENTRDSRFFNFKRSALRLSGRDQQSLKGSKEAPAGTSKPQCNPSPVRHSKSNFGLVYDGEAGAAPPVPKRYDSMKQLQTSPNTSPEEEDHVGAPWYQASVPRELSLELLAQEEVGGFIVRDSNSHPGCYALSVKVPDTGDGGPCISHYLIVKTPKGNFKLKGLDKEWETLTALITHHTVMQEMLPCTLLPPVNATNHLFSEAEDEIDGADDEDDDEDYHRVSDFSCIMKDLHI